MLKLAGQKVILGIPRIEDINSILDYYIRNETHLKPYETVKPDNFYTENYWIERIQKNQQNFNEGREAKFFIFRAEKPDEVIGSIGFTNITPMPICACSLGYSIDYGFQGKGLMFEAAVLGISYIFEKYDLHKIEASYMPHNTRSGKLLKRLGFQVEGYLRESVFINGNWEDHILTGLLKSDYKMIKQ